MKTLQIGRTNFSKKHKMTSQQCRNIALHRQKPSGTKFLFTNSSQITSFNANRKIP